VINYAVLVMSCDEYADLWEPFIVSFKRYWPDCRAPVFLVSETIDCDSSFFEKTILCGPSNSWTTRLGIAISQIDSETIIMLCDDYLLCDKVENNTIEDLIQVLSLHNIGNLRLVPSPPPDSKSNLMDGFGEVHRGTHYRISTQVGIWRRSYLEKFTCLQSTIWDFEKKGTVLSENFDETILTSTRPLFPYIDSVHKGKWENSGAWLCARNGIPLDFVRRPLMSNKDYLVKHAKGLVYDVSPTAAAQLAKAMIFLRGLMRKLT